MVMLQVDNKVDELAVVDEAVGEVLAQELSEILGGDDAVSQLGEPKTAHWHFSVPAPGVRYYTFD